MDNQIISIRSKNTIMGMFAGIEASVNRLLSSSDKYMGTNLLVKVSHTDDYTVIPVEVHTEDELLVVEEGIVTERYPVIELSVDDFDHSDEYKEEDRSL